MTKADWDFFQRNMLVFGKAILIMIACCAGFLIVFLGLEDGIKTYVTVMCEAGDRCKYADIDNNPEYVKAIEIANHPARYTNGEVNAAVQKLEARYRVEVKCP